MGFFSKKSEEVTEFKPDQPIEIPDDAANSKKIELINANLNKVNIQIESLNEVRRSMMERFAALTEQIGELRGQLIDTNKSLGAIEIKATKASDLVSSVHPDKLMIELQKEDGKIEAMRANLESNEAMMHNLMDQLKKVRNSVSAFRGMEQVMKMNEEVKDEIMNVKKVAATVEKHSDVVESIFSDLQKTYHEYNRFADNLDDIKKETVQLSSQVSSLNLKTSEFLSKKEFESRYAKMESFEKHFKLILEESQLENRKLKRNFELVKKELMLEFEKQFASARIMSDAFERMLIQNPEMTSSVMLTDYITKRKTELETEENAVKTEQNDKPPQ
jgi:uncharacterized coiled-coil DUF342 family protein